MNPIRHRTFLDTVADVFERNPDLKKISDKSNTITKSPAYDNLAVLQEEPEWSQG